MMREYQVRICERLGVQFPGPTRQHLKKDAPAWSDGFTPTSRHSLVASRASAMGHEERFPATRLSAGYEFRKETLAATRRNGRDAPIPVVHRTEIERQGSTQSGPPKIATAGSPFPAGRLSAGRRGGRVGVNSPHLPLTAGPTGKVREVPGSDSGYRAP